MEDINKVAKAIFDSNSKKGAISTTDGKKTLKGLKNLLLNENYNSEYIASIIFEENNRNGKIETAFGSKTYGGLLAMIHHSRTEKLKNYNVGQFKRGGALQSYTTTELAADLGISKKQMEVNKYDRDDLIALAEQQGLIKSDNNKTCYTIGGL